MSKDTLFREVTGLMIELQDHKGKTYGNAWCKHGEAISIFGNTSRKYDRIENIIKNFVDGKPLPPPDSDESVAETVADLAVYCILWMTWIAENRPLEYQSWKEKIIRMTAPKPEPLDGVV